MKKLFLKLSLFLPLVIFIVVFNYYVDCGEQFYHKDVVPKTFKAIHEGYAVTDLNLAYFDDRTLQKLKIEALTTPKDIVVFGSSRSMFISSDFFPGKALFNSCLYGNTIQDEIILYEMYRQKGMLPRTIIIGVDDWDFNKNTGLIKWHQYEQYYQHFVDRELDHPFVFRAPDMVPYKLKLLLSADYFMVCRQSLHDKGPYDFLMTKQRLNNEETILPDGSRTWNKVARERTVPEIEKIIKDRPFDPRGFVELDRNLKALFIKFIEAAQKDGVNVILYLPAYHPLTYDHIISPGQIKLINDVEFFLKDTAQRHGLTLLGSYDPHQLPVPESEFSDYSHLKDGEGIKKFFLQLKS